MQNTSDLPPAAPGLSWFAIWTWPSHPTGRWRIKFLVLPAIVISLLITYGAAYRFLVQVSAVGWRFDYSTGLVVSQAHPGYRFRGRPLGRFPVILLVHRFFRPAHAVDYWLRPEVWGETVRQPTPAERAHYLERQREPAANSPAATSEPHVSQRMPEKSRARD